MTCSLAIEEKKVTISPNDTVEKALGLLTEHNLSALSVVNKDGALFGLFSISILLKNLIAVPVSMSGDAQATQHIKIAAAPGVEKRFAKILPLDVMQVMERNPPSISPHEPLWEAASQLLLRRLPLCVVDKKEQYLGLITNSSLIKALGKGKDI